MIGSKNEAIKASLKATKARRMHQRCRVFMVKLDTSHLNTETLHQLRMLFLQAKWLYNHILAQPNVFKIDYKLSEVLVKVKDTFELRQLSQLSSHMKQSLITRTRDNIKGLTRLKEHGRKIGSLKFKSYVNSIPLCDPPQPQQTTQKTASAVKQTTEKQPQLVSY